MSNVKNATVDLTSCDREPIHIPGRVQSFGALIAVTPDWIINHHSENAQSLLGLGPLFQTGVALRAVISPAALDEIRGRVQALTTSSSVERIFALRLTDSSPSVDLAIHRSERSLVLEFEIASENPRGFDVYLKQTINRLEQCSTIEELCGVASKLLKAVLQFDRVMVYKFLPDGSGQVVGETLEQGMEPFLNLRYPASDIPKQARELYLRNLIRIIADVRDEGSPIVPTLGPGGDPLDLSLSTTRAVSPIHLEYLRNMGVGASLSISIVIHGKLWGLLACHHRTPRNVPLPTRTACELFAQIFAFILLQRLSDQTAKEVARGQLIHDQIMSQLAENSNVVDSFETVITSISSVIPFDGAAAWVEGRFTSVGITPTREEFLNMVPFLNTTALSKVFSTNALGQVFPPAEDFVERGAGAMVIPVSRTPRDYIVLFRHETAKNVNWAGNPEKPASLGPNGVRLTPRKSFEAWKQVVRGHSDDWTETQINAAESLRITLLEVILRMSDQAIQDKQRAHEQQTLLIAELNHRVRNILNLIRGLINQSKEGARDVAAFAEVIGGRINALAQAHDQITRQNWNPASLTSLIKAEAKAYINNKVGRVKIFGENIYLQPEAFTVVALVIHEMTTNAAKYGSLKDTAGWIEINIKRREDGAVMLAWQEFGGPSVQAPTRRGFGSTIIEKSIPFELKGSANISYELSGLSAKFVIPARFAAEPPDEDQTLEAQAPAQAEKSKAPRRVLLLEDNLIIALDLEDHIKQAGVDRVYAVASVSQALEVVRQNPIDFAFLDFNLGPETSEPVADALRKAHIPFAFATGYGEDTSIQKKYPGTRILQKPFGFAEIMAALAELK